MAQSPSSDLEPLKANEPQRGLVVQCDEVRPSCSNCVKFGVPCDFDTRPRPAPSKPDHGSSSSSTTITTTQPLRRGRPRSNWSAWADQIKRSSAAAQRCSCACPRTHTRVEDMELFHHYLTSTAETLGDMHLWSQGAVRLGFQHECVLELMLGMAAYHIASTKEQHGAQAYADTAERLCAAALPKATDLLGKISPDHGPPLYISSVLISFAGFARGPRPGDLLLVADGEQVPWLTLLRGVRVVIETLGWGAIFSGPLEPHFPRPEKDQDASAATTPPSPLPPFSTPAGTEDWRASLSGVSSIVAMIPDAATSEVYHKTIRTLSEAMESTFGAGHHASRQATGAFQVTMGWVYRVADEYVELLRAKEPVALLILAHFCALLRTQESCWFVRGWAAHVLREVIESSAECEKWLQWPIRFVLQCGD
ncbi:hypothetical protein N3K66_002851 [Trichothecium roseum]|uniref:Uncharacterized protein n=1 Tax=Trichothecium roseum TaxID=47278 RepID=A0ACC0V5C5_9HYPO|nr:hypothetical protein N3K66_002851 [Trichothecium roseum]